MDKKRIIFAINRIAAGIKNKDRGRPIAPASGEKTMAIATKNETIKLPFKITFLTVIFSCLSFFTT